MSECTEPATPQAVPKEEATTSSKKVSIAIVVIPFRIIFFKNLV